MTQQTNIGVFERDLTVWAPEAGVKVAYSLNDRVAVSVGYTFLYWTRVALAGETESQAQRLGNPTRRRPGS